MTRAMTREDELCLLLARGHLGRPRCAAALLEFLATSPQWPLVLERAYSHQVYPLLYRNLRDLGFPGVPIRSRPSLSAAYTANGMRNQLFAEELARLLRLSG